MKRNPSRRRILRQQQRPPHRTEARHKEGLHISAIIIVVHAIMMLMMIEPCYCHGRRHPFASTFTRHLSPRLTEHHHHHHESRRRSTSTFIPAWITSNSLTASASRTRTKARTRQTFSPVLNHERRIFPAATVATASALTRQGMTTRLSSSSSTSRMFSSTMTNNETSRQTTAIQDSSLGKAGDNDNDNDVTALSHPPKHMNINLDTDATIDDDWKILPALNPTINFKSWIIPTSHALNRILNAKEIQPYLATRLELLQHLQNRHGRFKVIRNVPADGPITHNKQQDATTTTHKLILLHPDTPTTLDDLDDSVQRLLRQECITIIPGPIIPISFTHHDFTSHYALTQVLPQHLHPVPTSFETIGHVAHLNLKSIHLPYKKIIGQVMLELIRPKVQVVMCKRGEVFGPFRTYDFEILASSSTLTATTKTPLLPSILLKKGEAAAATARAGAHDDDVDDNNNEQDMTMVNVTEWGITCHFNVRHVYWSSRLSTERQRLCLEELFVHHHHSNKRNELFIADAFCGVGALCLQAMKHYKKGNIVVWANDWNPAATASLQDNAKRNGIMSILQDTTTATSLSNDDVDRLVIRYGDAYEFLMDLGIQATSARHDNDEHNEKSYNNVTTTLPPQRNNTPRRLPDHVIMNYPLEAPTFLGALRWWPVTATPLKKKKKKPGRRVGKKTAATSTAAHDENDDDIVIPRVHVYTFARADPETHRSAEQVAVDLIAQNLIPGMGVTPSPRQKQQQDNDVNNDDDHSDVSAIDEDNVDDAHPIHCFKTTTTTRTTQDELNQEYNANVKIHAVRDVAPGKVVYCVSFSVTPRLLRHMQGDFDD